MILFNIITFLIQPFLFALISSFHPSFSESHHKIFGRANMWKNMVIENIVMMNLFPLSGYSQYLARVELHLPVFSQMASLSIPLRDARLDTD